MNQSVDLDRLTFHAVDRERWPDMERLFESRGAPKFCWCMVWRATPQEARQRDSTSRKAAMAGRAAAGTPVGLLGYLDQEPVAWCSVAPRASYRRLVEDGGPDAGVWSIACFFVVRRLRGLGVTRRLIAAAIDYARAQGATAVEAYPVDPDSPSYHFMGFVATFAAAGFRETGRAASGGTCCGCSSRPATLRFPGKKPTKMAGAYCAGGKGHYAGMRVCCNPAMPTDRKETRHDDARSAKPVRR